MSREAFDLEINGIVQGVGFRPFVYNLARSLELVGWVLNASDGVHIHIEGDRNRLDTFVGALRDKAPSMSRIDHVDVQDAPVEGFASFEIRMSDSLARASTLVSPDIATCTQCTEELFDVQNRRYHYPFINCTQCGPRFTIIDALPYDRPSTSMKSFTMCPECNAEYSDPSNRRFHAQPDACFACGPQLSWIDAGRSETAFDLASSDALVARSAELLLRGGILAIKGLGGYHLACDATNEAAVQRLRDRKRRPVKPFALMVPSLEHARELCCVDAIEEEVLTGNVRPVVLLRRKSLDRKSLGHKGEAEIARNVAGDLHELGVMLPYTPLQHLLLASVDRPLVMTSGNLSEEPILALDSEALDLLSSVADAFLANNRPILSRYDDSVVRVIDGIVIPVRRARGYAPSPIALPELLQSDSCVLACGPEQKNTFCFTRGKDAFVSQHLGDLENALTYAAWEDTVALYGRLFELQPTRLSCDMHPEYLSTKWAHEHESEDLPLSTVQHHHAHIAAVTGEHDRSDRVIGVALDGTGLGDDGDVWGGEILLSDWCDYERFAHLSTFPMPGGGSAIKNPCRMSYGVLLGCGLESHPGAAMLKGFLGENEEAVLRKMVERNLNCPRTSSAGRLLDSVAALCGICTKATYDGEPAIALEAAIYDTRTKEPVEDGFEKEACIRYAFTLEDGSPAVINPAPALLAVLEDLHEGCSPSIIAKRFHDALSTAIVETCLLAHEASGCDTVALGGGVFMNRYVSRSIRTKLEDRGLHVLFGKDLPVNDGCISYGQAIVTLARECAATERKDQLCALPFQHRSSN